MLDRFYKVEMTEQGVKVASQQPAREQEEKIDGKLVVESERTSWH